MTSDRLTAADIWPEDARPPSPDARVASLRRLLPATRRDIVEARPDLWPDDRTGHKRLEKDLVRLGAVCHTSHRIWHPPVPVEPEHDPRIVEPERVTRARRMAREGRSVIATDAAAVLATLDGLLDPRGGRSEGARLLEEWRRAQGLSVRRAAGIVGVPHAHLSRWERGVFRPRGAARETLEVKTGVPAFAWERSERAVQSNCTAQGAPCESR